MFEMKSYSRKELAMLYFPEVSAATAYVNFKRWLMAEKKGEALFEALRKRKILSKLNVKAIVDILGEP